MVNNAKLIPGLTEALGQSDAFLSFQEQLAAVAVVDRPVLLVGERGTGKELAAARLHYHSKRWQGPFVALNCSALAETLLESELFGHEPGAFTGASRLRRGRLETAHEGTLFLDELGGMPLTVQEKLLRAVEYKVFERVGASMSMYADVRIIAATNVDLRHLSARGRFKPDLLDRLCFEVLHVPPLRARGGDVVFLADHFAARMGLELGRKNSPRFADQALRKLEGHDWPGNIRELKNVVERAVFRAHNDVVRDVVLDPFASPYGPPGDASKHAFELVVGGHGTQEKNDPMEKEACMFMQKQTLPEAVAALERDLLTRALQLTKYNQRKAAEHLGLSYHQFRGLYRKYRGHKTQDR
ncbi:MAG TPA: phage shock protein operon transcriptional activator [Desulfonatronum sp.]|nr:phage shock protein operon transcriptional activator [Desulfonatronum sp.]